MHFKTAVVDIKLKDEINQQVSIQLDPLILVCYKVGTVLKNYPKIEFVWNTSKINPLTHFLNLWAISLVNFCMTMPVDFQENSY